MFQMCTLRFHTGSPNSSRFTNNPLTRSGLWVERDKPLVWRVQRLLRVRQVPCVRSICGVCRLPGLGSSGARGRVSAPQSSV